MQQNSLSVQLSLSVLEDGSCPLGSLLGGKFPNFLRYQVHTRDGRPAMLQRQDPLAMMGIYKHNPVRQEVLIIGRQN